MAHDILPVKVRLLHFQKYNRNLVVLLLFRIFFSDELLIKIYDSFPQKYADKKDQLSKPHKMVEQEGIDRIEFGEWVHEYKGNRQRRGRDNDLT